MNVQVVWVVLVSVILLIGVTGSAYADTVTFNDFSDVRDFTLNGVTPGINPLGMGALDEHGRNVLRLTNGLGQAGSAFLTNPITLEDAGGFRASFSTAFRFRISDQQRGGADGIVFVVQTVANHVLGNGSAGIGYQNINYSVGIEFDNWNNAIVDGTSESHVGVDLHGNIFSVARADTTPDLDSRPDDDWYAWIDYDGGTDRLEVRLSTTNMRPGAPILGYTVDLVDVLEQPDAFIGFTSGTGAGGADHDIVSWTFINRFDPIGVVPEPCSLALMALGVTAVLVHRRRTRTRTYP